MAFDPKKYLEENKVNNEEKNSAIILDKQIKIEKETLNKQTKIEKETLNKQTKKNIIKNIETIKDNIEKITQNNPINNQLINIIMDKNKKIEELQNNKIIQNYATEISNSSLLIINNTTITIRHQDNYINAVQLCQLYNKIFNEWFSLESTTELINELKLENDLQLIDNMNGIWIHPDLALYLAQWISPLVAIHVNKWSKILFSNNKFKDQEIEIKLKNQKIQLLQDQFQKKQQRQDYPEKNVIYILTTDDNKKKNNYIIGKAKELKNRLSTYNKTAEHEVVYYKECKNENHMNTVEMMVLTKLEEYREKANRDRFILPLEKDISFFTSIIDNSINFFN